MVPRVFYVGDMLNVKVTSVPFLWKTLLWIFSTSIKISCGSEEFVKTFKHVHSKLNFLWLSPQNQ